MPASLSPTAPSRELADAGGENHDYRLLVVQSSKTPVQQRIRNVDFLLPAKVITLTPSILKNY